MALRSLVVNVIVMPLCLCFAEFGGSMPLSKPLCVTLLLLKFYSVGLGPSIVPCRFGLKHFGINIFWLLNSNKQKYN